VVVILLGARVTKDYSKYAKLFGLNLMPDFMGEKAKELHQTIHHDKQSEETDVSIGGISP